MSPFAKVRLPTASSIGRSDGVRDLLQQVLRRRGHFVFNAELAASGVRLAQYKYGRDDRRTVQNAPDATTGFHIECHIACCFGHKSKRAKASWEDSLRQLNSLANNRQLHFSDDRRQILLSWTGWNNLQFV